MRLFREQVDKSQLLNNFEAIRIGLASPEKIRSWSSGEVTKPDDDQLQDLQAGARRSFLRPDLWSCYGLGMPVWKIQADEAQGSHLR